MIPRKIKPSRARGRMTMDSFRQGPQAPTVWGLGNASERASTPIRRKAIARRPIEAATNPAQAMRAQHGGET